MFDPPALMQTAQALARHAAARQVVIAENVANADTPGYAARDVAPFADTLRAPATPLNTTRARHLPAAGAAGQGAPQLVRDTATQSPNGNGVSLEREMMRAAETRQAHDLALTVYGSARKVLRTALGR